MNKGSRIQYFDQDGNENLTEVIKSVKAYLKNSDPDERPTWVVFLTTRGEGPLLAYHELLEFDIRVAAVTFPATYCVILKDGQHYHPEIPDKVAKFFKGVEIPIITGSLPFDPMIGSSNHNHDMDLIVRTMKMFSGGFHLAIQAVLQACDHGTIRMGEQVIAASGDCAFVVTASDTHGFLSDKAGLRIHEIICKPRQRVAKRQSLPEVLPKNA